MNTLWDYAFQNGWVIWQAFFEGRRSDYFLHINGVFRIRVCLDDKGEILTAHKWSKGLQSVSVLPPLEQNKEERVLAWLCA